MERARFLSAKVKEYFGAIQSRYTNEAERRRLRKRWFNKLGGWSYKKNGARECERRMRQIAAGSLRMENGYRP